MSPEQPNDTNEIETLTKNYLQATIEICTESKLLIRGTLVIEDGENPPLPLTFKAFPNGDWIAWLFKDNEFKLFALVNNKIKHVISVPADKVHELEQAINEIEKEIGKEENE